MKIQPNEIEIRGSWFERDQKVEADDNCRRIEYLLQHYLREVGRDASGWDVLYVDTSDGRYWELLYPQSELHGGGPPLLRYVGINEAHKKYGVVPDASPQ